MIRTNGARTVAAPRALWGLALAVSAPAAHAQEPAPAVRTMTVEDCVATAILHNPDSLSSDYDVADSEAARAGVRGQFGPQVHADANLQQWTGPYELQFLNQAFQVRNAFTWMAGVTVTQPLTPLWTIFEQYKAATFGTDVAAIRRLETRRQVAFQAIEAYYRLLESERLSSVADVSVVQLESAQRQAQSNFTNGVIAKNDLLRATLALAAARQRSIQARGTVVLVRAQLAQAMGLSPDEGVDGTPFDGEPPPLGEVSLSAAEEHAVRRRAEVRELARRIDQTEAGKRYAKTKLVPQVSAVANYTHTEGSPFQQTDAAYVGLIGSWDVWDWGTTWSGIDRADAQIHQALLTLRKVEDQVRVEARQAFVSAGTAREALGVARVAVTQAEENFRIVTKKFENAAATSFDVVDAEALLTQARGQVETALYDYLVACAGLERATGAPLPGEK